jgi:hypothetical protein
VFLKFPDSSLKKIFPWEHGNVKKNSRIFPHRITP